MKRLGFACLFLALISASIAGPTDVLTVQVQDADGKAIPDVTVFHVDLKTNCVLRGTSLEGGGQRLHTDDHGSFHFVFSDKPEALVVATDYGFGLAQSFDMTNRPVIVVRPWACLDGIRTDHGHPVAKQLLAVQIVDRGVDPILINMVGLDNKALTDSRGRFHFTHVPPVDVFLEDMQPWLGVNGRRKAVPARLDETQILPGITNHFDLATTGRIVTGRLELGPGLTNTFDLHSLDKAPHFRPASGRL